MSYIAEKYSVLYSDNPWTFKTWSDAGRDRSPDYKLMSLYDIVQIGKYLPDVMAKDSVLLLWAISPLLPHALEVMNAWGYEYKTVAFTWVKTLRKSNGYHMGLGYYTRSNTEYVLLGTKGKTLKRFNKGVRQLIDFPEAVVTPIEEHSKKPHLVMDRIDALFGDCYKLELFARRDIESEYWTCIGNAVTGNDITVDLVNIARYQEEYK